MKKLIRTAIATALLLGVTAPLSSESVSANHIQSHTGVYRLARHYGHRRYRYSRRSHMSVSCRANHTSKARHQKRHHARLGSNHNDGLNSVVARVAKEDSPALQADRSSLEQVKATAKEIAREAKTDHISKKARRTYLKKARSLTRQANRLLAECN